MTCFQWMLTLGDPPFLHKMNFVTFVKKKKNLAESCLNPSPLNNQNAAERVKSFLLTVPKIIFKLLKKIIENPFP